MKSLTPIKGNSGNKGKGKSFFDYSDKEKKAILHKAAVEGAKEQAKLLSSPEPEGWEKAQIAYKIVGIVRGWDMANHQDPDDIYALINEELKKCLAQRDRELIEEIVKKAITTKPQKSAERMFDSGYNIAIRDIVALIRRRGNE